MLQNPVEFFLNLSKKICPECGENVEDQAESYILECEHCLSKKVE
ncbi:protein YhfH [Heyndrickxia vini]|uniref:YhfH family protein n=1 Tax=Heyndrickxia vini TaxID=1476025 RepID=A0ABX7E7F0_9BACI|nr:protein YhfH [Heyndrickxia vini]QQZ11185.1 YhfH family protein [Heyndrickxia vini]